MKFFKLFLLILFLTTIAFAQQKTLKRQYVPIIRPVAGTPLLGLTIQNWHAYKYNLRNNSWSLVPWQVDERSNDGKYNKKEFIDGVIGQNDEILFMPGDLGDRAPQTAWPDDEQSRQYRRLELAFTDSLDVNQQGWIYLFRNDSPDSVAAGYFQYIAAPVDVPAADTVKSRVYRIGHNADGWIDFVAIELSPNQDLIDRLKLRLSGTSALPDIGSYAISEDMIKAQDDPVTFHPGNIRSFHDERANLFLPFGGPPVNADYQMQYFPYSFRITLDNFSLNRTLLVVMGVNNLRSSLDLSEAAIGMKFYSNKNRNGIDIDGIPDSPDISLDETFHLQWAMATGDAGSILLIQELPDVENSTMTLYYRDDKSGGTNDSTADTGDMRSFGDMGLRVRANGPALETDNISLKYNAYFLNIPNLKASFADSLAAWEKTPLSMNVIEQNYDPSVVENRSGIPGAFYLYPAYPNPFKPGSGSVIFRFSNKNTNADLSIFNVLGQEIMHFSHLQKKTISWNGLDGRGYPVIPGIYFYRLQSGRHSMTRKILFLR
ncbi:MAG: T9SS type A sorting domain-containing protein [Calditrichaeota bacterium]|nr:T9SS type A sorting domain-containing protein [Calditrichota bacterium]